MEALSPFRGRAALSSAAARASRSCAVDACTLGNAARSATLAVHAVVVAAPVRNDRLVGQRHGRCSAASAYHMMLLYMYPTLVAAVRQVLGGLGLFSATAAFVLNNSRMPQSAWNKWARGKAHAAIDQQAPIVHVHAAAEQSRARSNGKL